MNDEVGFFSARIEPKGVSAGFEFVTPELAEELLRDFNTHNRRLRSRQVSLYAESMRQDRWSLNGEPIQFDADGVLLNGQHRLTAISDRNGDGQLIPFLDFQSDTVTVELDLEDPFKAGPEGVRIYLGASGTGLGTLRGTITLPSAPRSSNTTA